MYDAHVHLDFMSNGEEVAAAAEAAGVRLFAGTVTPEGYLAAKERFSKFGNVELGLGLHPWWVESTEQADEFLKLLPTTPYVNEIGLDFGKRHLQTRDVQRETFTRIAAACAEQGGKKISLHSVHATKEVIDILEQADTFETCEIIFHWFSGPSDQLKRAVQAGCYFSVGLRMLATGKGREYVKAIPADRLLTETDAPPKQGQPYSLSELQQDLWQAEEAIAHIKRPPVRLN